MRFWAWIQLGCLALGAPALSAPAEPAPEKPAVRPDGSAFFGVDRSWRIEVTVSPENWAAMEPAAPSRGGGPGGGRPGAFDIDFPEVKADVEIDGKKLADIGLRFKGNSSFMMARNSLKRSLKVDFNQFVKGQHFLGLSKLNLNNNAMDPTQMREALAYEVFRKAGVPAPRTAFARVYLSVPGRVQHQYLGAYTVVEQVDKPFLRRHFPGEGALFKPEANGVPYLGEDWAAYEQTYLPKTTVSEAAKQRLIGFTKLVNQADAATFAREIGSYLDVDEFLNYLACNVALSNQDSPLAMPHNYYLYLDEKSGRIAWLPWDMNEAFGGFGAGTPADKQAELSIKHPHTGNHALIDRLFAQPAAYAAYKKHLQDLLAGPFSAASFTAALQRAVPLVRPAVQEESPAALQQFEAQLVDPMAGAAQPGIPGGPGGFGPMGGPRRAPALKAFIAARIASLESQLAGKSEGYVPGRGFGPPGQGLPGGMGPGGFGAGSTGPDIPGGPAVPSEAAQLLANQLLKSAGGGTDERITLTQWSAGAKRWASRWDANKDGRLSKAEVARGVSTLLGVPAGTPASDDPSPTLAVPLLKAAGARSKAPVTVAALSAALARRGKMWDANHDGSLEGAELRAGLSQLLGFPGL